MYFLSDKTPGGDWGLFLFCFVVGQSLSRFIGTTNNHGEEEKKSSYLINNGSCHCFEFRLRRVTRNFVQLYPEHFFILPDQEEIKIFTITMVICLVTQTWYNFNALMPTIGAVNRGISIFCSSDAGIYFGHKVELTGFAGYLVL